LDARIRRARNEFTEGLDDDLNVSKALAALSDFVRDVNILMETEALGSEGARIVLSFMKETDGVLGIFSFERESLDGEVESLIEQRNAARKRKDFETADRIRDTLVGMGIVLEDKKEGTRWKKA
jgi:cysteinyl-tRNA synthetase